jgi:formate/nitrite transporter FocA (FNT family)
VANVVGAALFAFAIAHLPVFEAPIHDALLASARETIAPPFGAVIIRGVFAGWLIALMVWLLPFAETSRIWVIIALTYVVGLGQFSHVIAGSVDTLYLVARGEVSFGAYIVRFLAPSLLGNIVGGVSLVAAVAHAQYIAGGDATEA